MTRTGEAYDFQVNAELTLFEIESALDMLADNASDFSPFISWHDLRLLEKRLRKIRKTCYPAHPESLETNYG
jgi:hypothetical protein